MLYLLMEAQNYLTDPRIKEALRPRSQLVIPFEYHEGLYELLPLFEKAVSLYDNVDNKIFTQYYFKVRKTYLEMQHYALLHQNA